MSPEEYPEDVEIKKTNFRTDQQEEAAETIAEEWPSDLDTIAEKGGHVRMFYSQVLEQFLGPADAEMTFSEIEDEHGSLEQWADDGDAGDEGSDAGDEAAAVETPDVEEIEPGTPGEAGGTAATDEASTDGTSSDPGTEGADSSRGDDGASAGASDAAAAVDFADVAGDAAGEGDVDERRRAWFAAGFREGVEFALRNPDLFDGQ